MWIVGIFNNLATNLIAVCVTRIFANNIIDKSGAWFSYNDQKIGQGKENVKKYLKDNPAVADEIIAKIKNITNLTSQIAAESQQ